MSCGIPLILISLQFPPSFALAIPELPIPDISFDIGIPFPTILFSIIFSLPAFALPEIPIPNLDFDIGIPLPLIAFAVPGFPPPFLIPVPEIPIPDLPGCPLD